ncbi:hypothetical protein LXL04_037712 [Taraxacum kok-saghyz]
MAHEEHTPRCINSIGGGRLSKKLKNKKVPQRGMGVAQLEKLISDEHQNNDVAVLKPNSTNFKPPPPSIPLPPPLPPNYHRSLIPITDATNPVYVSKPTHTISNGGNPWSRLYSGGDYHYEPENPNPNQCRALDHRSYAASISSNLSDLRPYSITTRQRSHLIQQQCSSSMGNSNASLGTTTTTSSSSSVMNFQMELPSNQIYYGNNFPPLWSSHEENQEMVGMKRPYPFSMEYMPIPSFNFKSSPFSPLSRSNESASCSHGSTTGLEISTPVFRENHHPSSLVAKDFLTLATPRSSMKEKLAPLSIGESTKPQYKGQSQINDPSGSDWSTRHQLYSFFPAENNNGEEGEHVDLNLKL